MVKRSPSVAVVRPRDSDCNCYCAAGLGGGTRGRRSGVCTRPRVLLLSFVKVLRFLRVYVYCLMLVLPLRVGWRRAFL